MNEKINEQLLSLEEELNKLSAAVHYFQQAKDATEKMTETLTGVQLRYTKNSNDLLNLLTESTSKFRASLNELLTAYQKSNDSTKEQISKFITKSEYISEHLSTLMASLDALVGVFRDALKMEGRIQQALEKNAATTQQAMITSKSEVISKVGSIGQEVKKLLEEVNANIYTLITAKHNDIDIQIKALEKTSQVSFNAVRSLHGNVKSISGENALIKILLYISISIGIINMILIFIF
ncbi:hypothetical protein FACS1894187_20160 [Synergistales bacterium]|nr:hypothetical protein FACS1894187_20160 [Synergistales bacterium]